MFTDEGRWRGVMKEKINNYLRDMTLDELDIVFEFIENDIINYEK